MTKLSVGSMIPALALAAGLGLSTAANAATIEYQVLVDGSLVSSSSSATGLLNVDVTSSPLFSEITLNATGVPLLTSPDLSTTSTSISTASGFTGTHTLEIDITQVGLTMPTGLIAFGSNMTLNNLIPQGVGGVNSAYSNYVDPSNAAFGVTDPVASLADTPNSSASSGNSVSTFVDVDSSPYSETQVLTATFSVAGADLQSTDQMTGSPVGGSGSGSPIPEPATLAILGVGLVGLGIIRRPR